jgi:predicted DNA-binding transcriptional regulator AlpA
LIAEMGITRWSVRLGTPPKPQAQVEKRYVRVKAAAACLGVTVSTLRSWRSRRPSSGPPVARINRMVMYSVKELEQFMEQRTVEKR